jgi:hypothetical protein
MSRALRFESMRRIRGWLLSQNSSRLVSVVWAADRPIYRVPSETRPGIAYDVFFDEDGAMVCVCPDFAARHKHCKHCVEVLHRFYPALAPPVPTSDELKKLGPSEMYFGARRYKHVPFIYAEGLSESTRRDHAIANEGERIETQLLDIAAVLNARYPQSGAHRHPLAAGDRVLALVLRDYHRKSYRKMPSLLRPFAKAGEIAFAPCKTTLIEYMQSEDTLSYLREAYLLTTTPFRLMERDVIVDASGISPYYFESYRAVKYGDHVSPETRWFRMHVAIGRISHAVLGFNLALNDGHGTGDITHLAGLLDSVQAAGFELRYVIADNGYLDRKRIDDVDRRGARLICPLKGRNHRPDGNVKGDLLPLARFADENPEIYDELKRARQPIEGIFSTEKRHSNRLASIGTKDERERALIDASQALFYARICEFFIRMIRWNLTRINMEEHLRNRFIRFSKGSVFSHVRELIDDDVA